MPADKRSQLRDLLEDAQAKLVEGDAADAERRAKAISAIVRAERDVAELMAAQQSAASEEDEETLRAELRRRLARFAAANGAPFPPDLARRLGVEGVAE